MRRARGVATRMNTRLQTRLAPEQIWQNAVNYEKNAAKRSNFRVMLEPLNDPVEEGMKKKYARDRIWKFENGENVNLRKYAEDFEKQKMGIFLTLTSRRDLSEWDAANARKLALLKELQQIILSGSNDAIANMRGQMGLVSMGRRGDIGASASEALARIIDRAEKGLQITETARKETSEAITKIIQQEIGIQDALATATYTDNWEDLTPETQAHVERFYFNFRWAADDGTFNRDAELQVLCEREDAPYRVREGRERQVYAAILAWRALKEKLKAASDEEERTLIRDDMRKQEEIVNRWTSEFTGNFNGREEDGAVGINQVKQSAWTEIRHTFDGLRDENGKVRKTIVQVGATPDQGSWEGIGLTSEIYLQFGTAKNALKVLKQIAALVDGDPERERFLTNYFNTIDRKGEQRKRLQAYRTKFQEAEGSLRHARADLEKAEERQREAASQVSAAYAVMQSADEQYKSMERVVNDAIAAGRRAPGGGEDPFSQVRTKFETAIRAHESAKAAEEAATREADKLKAKINGSPADGSDNLETVRDRFKSLVDEWQRDDRRPTADETRDAAEARRQHFTDLIAKLEKFTTQERLVDEFYGLFSDKDVKVIAHLNSMDTYRNERTGKTMIGQKAVEDGNIRSKKNPERIRYQGDYAFINAWALGEQDGQLSPDVLEQMLDNPAAFPQLKALMDEAERDGKIVIVTSFAVQNDIDGGMIARVTEGVGREFNFDAAEELKKANGWTDAELFAHWLDDLNIQTALGVRPEEIERRYTEWAGRQYLFRQKHFSADKGWTFINTTVASSTPAFFETTIRRMVDAGLDMTSQALRRSPFFQQLGKPNEYAITVTNKDQVRQVFYRGQELTSLNEKAEKTQVARTYKSLMNELELYYSRTFIGGQSTSVGEGLSEDDTSKLGAFSMANMSLIRKKMMTLKGIYQDPNLTADERLQKMLDWAQGRLSYTREQLESLKSMGIKIVNPDEHTDEEIERLKAEGYHVIRDGDPDPGMTNLTYELLDENGEFIVESANEELWAEMDAHSQWIGKLGRNLREATLNLSNTLANPYATERDIVIARQLYNEALGDRRNWEMNQMMLGMQVSGQLKGMDNKAIGKVIAKTYAGITGMQMRRLQEQQFRSIFDLDNEMPPNGENAARIIIGKLTKSRIAETARSIGARLGLGDRFLNEISQDTLASWIRNKHDSRIFKVAAAHYNHAVQTGYQANTGLLDSLFNPMESDYLYPGSGARGLVHTRTGEAAMKGIERRIEEDVADILDRTIGNNMHLMIKAASKSGWTIEEIMKRLQEGEMNDTQVVEYNTNRRQFQWNMYGKKATRLSMVEDRFLNEVIARGHQTGLNNPIGGVFMPDNLARWGVRQAGRIGQAMAGIDQRPADSRAVGYKYSDPPLATQAQMKRMKQSTGYPQAGTGPVPAPTS